MLHRGLGTAELLPGMMQFMFLRSSAFVLAAAGLAHAADPQQLQFNIKWVNPPTSTLPRGVSHRALMSKAMGVEVGYHIYLPPSYESSSERFPVLYWLHGAGSDENAGLPIVEMFDKAIEAGQMMPAIMVIPNGGKRSEYRDWEPQKVLPETFIIRELIPYIDANYRTIKDRRGRWIEGMSMGGNGALKFALKFPDLFSSVVAYAGSYEPLPKDGFLYPGVAPEFRDWLQTLAKWYIADHDPFELAKFNRYRLNGLRIRLVAGTMDVALKDSEALHKYFQDIGIVHEYNLYLGIAHNQAAYYERGGVEGFRFHLPTLEPARK
jgi:enterochelin esterase-like enzyme